MKEVFYKYKDSGDCYKLKIETSDQSMIDKLLDVISPEMVEFITEKEFIDKYEYLITIDVFDETLKYKIGELTTEEFDPDEEEIVFE